MIHPTAIIHPKARLDPTTRVGPYAVIDESVELGPNCIVGPYAYLTGLTKIGAGNRFFPGCVIGEGPQDLKYKGEATRLEIGEHNSFREHVTVHRSTDASGVTVIGSNNLLMHHSHVAHNCLIGNHVILAGGSMLAGHVEVGDRALVSGNCLVHQFIRIGTLAMMQGGSAISKDLPPFTVARGHNGICGLNTVGLRRAGMASADRLELRRLYVALFRSGRNLRAAMAEAQAEFTSAPARLMMEFIASAKRGVPADTGQSDDSEEEEKEEKG